VSKEVPGAFIDDPKMSSDDLDKVYVFSEVESSQKWVEFVSTLNRHFMLMHNGEWPSRVITDGNFLYRWIDDWNRDDFNGFSSRLQSIGIPEDSTLYVFWMKELGLKTVWSVFRRNWGNFLYEDEGCILVFPEQKSAFVFSNGSAWLGERGQPKT
jgi:hypothetical protein